MKRTLPIMLLVASASSMLAAELVELGPRLDGAGKIVFEAELGKVKASFEIEDDAEASGGKAVGIKVDANKAKAREHEFCPGSVELKFRVEKEGNYSLWVRLYRPARYGTCPGFSVYATLDKAMDKKDAFIIRGAYMYENWHWIMVKRKGRRKFRLVKGLHTLRLQNRVDGIKIDQFAFIAADEYVPVSIETPTQKPGY